MHVIVFAMCQAHEFSASKCMLTLILTRVDGIIPVPLS